MLNPFIKEATESTPDIKMDAKSGIIEMKGYIITIDTHAFFEPIFDWLDSYLTTPQQETNLIFHLEYINTTASKYLLDIFKRVEKLYNANKIVKVTWICDKDDFDIMETAEDYQMLTTLPFEIIEE